MKQSFSAIFRQLLPIRSQNQWHFVLLFPWFIPLITYWVLGERYWSSVGTFAGATALNMTIACTCLVTLDQLTDRVIRRYPSIKQTWSRVWRLFVVFTLVTPIFILGGILLYEHLHLFGYSHDPASTIKVLLFNIPATMLSVGIDESVYSLNKWRENTIEKEQLKKINLQSQFESLKSQVNPHFLFNSLNSLSSLIADEPQKAEEFVDEMAKVYRYLLQTNEGELTTLATELAFIRSYYHLLKTRYGAGIQLQVNVPQSYLICQLPPLTLQMLVENAVKHNVIHVDKPLLIEIQITDSGQLQVRNNRQRKTGRVVSNQVGLNNISAKYRLLAQTDPVILSDDEQFSIILPLLNSVSV